MSGFQQAVISVAHALTFLNPDKLSTCLELRKVLPKIHKR